MKPLRTEGDDENSHQTDLTARLIVQHKNLQKECQELKTQLEKLRITAEDDLNVEKKQHAQTQQELSKIRQQNRQLNKDIQDLENKLQLKEKEIDDLKSRLHVKNVMDHRFHERDSALFHKFIGKNPTNSNAYDAKVMSLIRVCQDKTDQLEEENKKLYRQITQLETQLAKSEEEKIMLKTDFGQTYNRLSKEIKNRIAVVESENINFSEDNQALRERLAKLDAEVNRLRIENLELLRKIDDLKDRPYKLDLGTPDKSEAKLSGDSTPQANMMRTTKSFTTSKKTHEGKMTEREDMYLPRANSDMAEMSLSEYRHLISEIVDIYNLRTPAEIIPSIKKTEKVMQAIPKLQKLLGEIAGIILARGSGHSPNDNHIESIVPYLKTWSNQLDELDSLKELKKKIIERIGLAKETENIDILKNIEDLLYISSQYNDMRLRSQRDTNENMEHKMVKYRIIDQLTKMLGAEPTITRLKQMMVQLKDLNHFINIIKIKFNLDSDMSNEACLTQLLKYMENAKRNEHAGYIILELQKIMNCSINEVLPRVEEMMNDAKNRSNHGLRRQF